MFSLLTRTPAARHTANTAPRLPSEREPRATTWLTWPSSHNPELLRAYEAVTTTAAGYGPIQLLVDPADAARMREFDGPIEIANGGLSSCFAQSGPSFVVGGRGVSLLGWAGTEMAQRRGRKSGLELKLQITRSDLVMDRIETDGWGTALLDSRVLTRNPDRTQSEIEQEMGTLLGIRRVIWVPPLSPGHHDNGHGFPSAVFAGPGTVLVHDQPNIGHPDNEVTIATVAALSQAQDAVGRPLTVIRVPAPTRLRDGGAWVRWTYLGFGLVDGAVIVPLFDDPNDTTAIGVLSKAFPGREVVGVDARPLAEAGHSVGCLMRGQPTDR